ADRHRHRLLLPAAGRHHGARPRPGHPPDGAGPRRDGGDRPPVPPAARGRLRLPARGARAVRDRPDRSGAPALRQRLADAAHRRPAARPQAQAALPRPALRRHPRPPAVQPGAARCRDVRGAGVRAERRHLPLRLRARAAARHAGVDRAPQDRPHARPDRGLRGGDRVARAVLPVRVHGDPERHRRSALLPGRRPDPGARRRPAEHPVPGSVRPPQRARDDDRRVRPGATRTRRRRAARRRRRRAAQGVLPAARPRGPRRRRRLGGSRELGASALLRERRPPLHAVQPRLLRHGPARGHELRHARRGEPHLRLPARHGPRQARSDGVPGRRRGPLRRGDRLPARPSRGARPDGTGGTADRRHALLLDADRGRSRGVLSAADAGRSVGAAVV
ncbi:MAG: hypothetical protein AVDCRST_MAG79-1112, partial [uncultured Thermoleophilia bacterium]